MSPVNTHEQLVLARGAGLPCVAVTPAMGYGRGDSYQSGWHIYVPDKITDPEAHWTDYGKKWFSRMGGKEEALRAAKDWASKHYGPVPKWTRNRMRAYVDSRVAKQFPIRKNEP